MTNENTVKIVGNTRAVLDISSFVKDLKTMSATLITAIQLREI